MVGVGKYRTPTVTNRFTYILRNLSFISFQYVLFILISLFFGCPINEHWTNRNDTLLNIYNFVELYAKVQYQEPLSQRSLDLLAAALEFYKIYYKKVE